jgi:hypothetical protein
MDEVLRVLGAAAGLFIVVATLGSAIKTVILPVRRRRHHAMGLRRCGGLPRDRAAEPVVRTP